MQRSTRTTRSKASPGLVDRPNPRRSSAVITEEKTKKQKAATLKAEERRRRVAQVAEVEKEVRKAQEEAQRVGQKARGTMIKKTFLHPAADATVSPYRYHKINNNLLTVNDHRYRQPRSVVARGPLKWPNSLTLNRLYWRKTHGMFS